MTVPSPTPRFWIFDRNGYTLDGPFAQESDAQRRAEEIRANPSRLDQFAVVETFETWKPRPQGAGVKSPSGAREELAALLSEREATRNALRELCAWTAEHLDALEEPTDDDDEQVITSLRMIVTGQLGCTEEADYDAARWACLAAIREVLGAGLDASRAGDG